MIVIAALLATSSAINATLYGAGRLTYVIAKTGEGSKGLSAFIVDKGAPGAKAGQLGAFRYDPLAITSWRPRGADPDRMTPAPVGICRNNLVAWGVLKRARAAAVTTGPDGRLTGLVLADGTRLAADLLGALRERLCHNLGR